ncbi:hypothetical protein I7I50_00169 [Histoplasma capsulatum G186AR]|uniref:Uncharacterized protein n=1 Tax=Ajellomyces capsulatus TaxID=5037 RepID=A0A8H7YI81_AJECA|nr:hypothetical protein I7I52_07438 [Histoplasma capsulatum]QSS72351.1 hypothetical protein I7I50_00169 [Histoplasma capsulatum G186AR]
MQKKKSTLKYKITHSSAKLEGVGNNREQSNMRPPIIHDDLHLINQTRQPKLSILPAPPPPPPPPPPLLTLDRRRRRSGIVIFLLLPCPKPRLDRPWPPRQVQQRRKKPLPPAHKHSVPRRRPPARRRLVGDQVISDAHVGIQPDTLGG